MSEKVKEFGGRAGMGGGISFWKGSQKRAFGAEIRFGFNYMNVLAWDDDERLLGKMWKDQISPIRFQVQAFSDYRPSLSSSPRTRSIMANLEVSNSLEIPAKAG
jgi:hypothetical protein